MPAISPSIIKEIHTAYYARQKGYAVSEIDCSDEEIQSEVLPELYTQWHKNTTYLIYSFYLLLLTGVSILVHPMFIVLLVINICCVVYFGVNSIRLAPANR
jgi:hypothetical protein